MRRREKKTGQMFLRSFMLAAAVLGTVILPANVFAGETETNGYLPVAKERETVNDTVPADIGELNEYGQLHMGQYAIDCYGSYEKLVLSEAGQEQYPALQSALTELNLQAEEQARISLQYTWEGAKTAVRNGVIQPDPMAMNDEGTQYVHYDCSSRMYLTRCDTQVLSFMRHDVWQDGSGYEQELRTGYSLDPLSGKELTVKDVFTDADGVRDVLKTRFHRYWSEEEYPAIYDDLENFFAGNSVTNISFNVGYEGVNFYFQTDFASYREMLTDKVPFSELADMVQPKYLNHQKGYVEDLICNDYFADPFPADINGDGTIENVLCNYTKEEYDQISHIVITREGVYWSCPIYGYEIDQKLVCDEQGKYFLYLMAHEDNDYEQTKVISLGDTFAEVGDIDGAVEENYGWEKYQPWTMTDIKDFKVETRTYLLSTRSLQRSCRLGEDGMPVYTQDYWYDTLPFELVMKQPMTFPLVNEAGDVIGEAQLSADEELEFYRSDNERVVDFKRVNDGSLVRVEVKTDDWPQTVQGIDIEEIFDGMVFAG